MKRKESKRGELSGRNQREENEVEGIKERRMKWKESKRGE